MHQDVEEFPLSILQLIAVIPIESRHIAWQIMEQQETNQGLRCSVRLLVQLLRLP